MYELGSNDAPSVSIIVLCQDNLAMLSDCLTSIARSVDARHTPYEVIVLFQQTSRRAARAVLSCFEGVRGVHSSLNLGFGAGNNFAASFAAGEYIVFLNDDALPQHPWLEHLVAAVESRSDVGAVGSRLLFPDFRLQESGAIIWSDGSCFPPGRGAPAGSFAYSYARDVHYASANGLLVRSATFWAAGGFDDRYFPAYYEDVDLCMAIRHRLGQRVFVEPRSTIVHYESATSGRDPAFRDFLFRRNQSAFMKKWADELSLYPAPEPQSVDAVERAILSARGNPKRVLLIDDRVPSIGMGSGAGRITDFLRDLNEGGFAVTFAPTDRRSRPSQNVLGGLGVDLITETPADHVRRPEKRYDAVVISRPHNFSAYYAVIRETQPGAAIIYDVEALYHRRLLLQASAEKDAVSRGRREAEADRMEVLEMEIARSVDRLVAISDNELDWLHDVEGHAPIEYMLPLSSEITHTPAALGSRAGAIFVAGWLAGEESPNVGALQWYAKEILPLVRQSLPNFVTYVSGSNPPLSVQALAGEGIELVGVVPSVRELYLSARVALAPILIGAGVKIKTVEALQFGVPVVATSVGAEGLHLTDKNEVDIADDAGEYAKRLIALCLDDRLWLDRRNALLARVAHWGTQQIHWTDVTKRALSERRSPRMAGQC